MTLSAELCAAEEKGVGLVDPIEFAYVRRLVLRGAELPLSSKERLWTKAKKRLDALLALHDEAQIKVESSLAHLASLDEEYASQLQEEFAQLGPDVLREKIQAVVGADNAQAERANARLKAVLERVQVQGISEAAEHIRTAKSLLEKRLRLGFVEHAHRAANLLEFLRLEHKLKEPRAKLSLSRMSSSLNLEAGLYNPEVLVTRALSELSLASPEAAWSLLDWARDYAQLARMLGDESEI